MKMSAKFEGSKVHKSTQTKKCAAVNQEAYIRKLPLFLFICFRFPSFLKWRWQILIEYFSSWLSSRSEQHFNGQGSIAHAAQYGIEIRNKTPPFEKLVVVNLFAHVRIFLFLLRDGNDCFFVTCAFNAGESGYFSLLFQYFRAGHPPQKVFG